MSQITNNTTALQSILETVNKLPEAGGLELNPAEVGDVPVVETTENGAAKTYSAVKYSWETLPDKPFGEMQEVLSYTYGQEYSERLEFETGETTLAYLKINETAPSAVFVGATASCTIPSDDGSELETTEVTLSESNIFMLGEGSSAYMVMLVSELVAFICVPEGAVIPEGYPSWTTGVWVVDYATLGEMYGMSFTGLSMSVCAMSAIGEEFIPHTIARANNIPTLVETEVQKLRHCDIKDVDDHELHPITAIKGLSRKLAYGATLQDFGYYRLGGIALNYSSGNLTGPYTEIPMTEAFPEDAFESSEELYATFEIFDEYYETGIRYKTVDGERTEYYAGNPSVAGLGGNSYTYIDTLINRFYYVPVFIIWDLNNSIIKIWCDEEYFEKVKYMERVGLGVEVWGGGVELSSNVMPYDSIRSTLYDYYESVFVKRDQYYNTNNLYKVTADATTETLALALIDVIAALRASGILPPT